MGYRGGGAGLQDSPEEGYEEPMIVVGTGRDLSLRGRWPERRTKTSCAPIAGTGPRAVRGPLGGHIVPLLHEESCFASGHSLERPLPSRWQRHFLVWEMSSCGGEIRPAACNKRGLSSFIFSIPTLLVEKHLFSIDQLPLRGGDREIPFSRNRSLRPRNVPTNSPTLPSLSSK